MAEELGREVVVFEATGLEEITLETEKLEEAVKRAYAQQMALNAKLSDPVYRAQAAAVGKLADANRQLAASTDKVTTSAEDAREQIGKQYAAVEGLNKALKDPATRQRALDTAKLAAENRKLLDTEVKLTEQQKRRQAIAERAGRLRSGEYLRGRRSEERGSMQDRILALRERQAYRESGALGVHAGRDSLLRRAEAKEDRRGHYAALVGEHGRIAGGAMVGLERARPGMLAAGAVGAVGVGMARSGFSGTVEGNVLAMELHLLNREIAGALLPVIKDLTRALRWVRQKAEKLTGGQQDALGYGIAGAAGLGALGLATNTISTALGGLGKLIGATGIAATGSVAASVAAQSAGSAAGTAAGTALAGGAGGALAGKAASTGGRFGRAGRVAGGAAKLAPWIAAAASVYEGIAGPYYSQNRREGHSKLTSGLAALGGGFMDTLSQPLKWMGYDGYREGYMKNKGINSAGHHTPLIADAGFESFDDSYKRVATATSLQAAIEQEPGGKLAKGADSAAAESASTLKLIFDLMRSLYLPQLR